MKRFLHVIFTLLCLFLLPRVACAQQPPISYNNGQTTNAIKLPGSSCVYTWTIDHPEIGLSSGTGNTIPSFKAVNPGTAPIAATISMRYATDDNLMVAFLVTQNAGKVWMYPGGINAGPSAVTLGSEPYGIAVTPNRNRVYVTNRTSNTVSVIKVTVTHKMPSIDYRNISNIAVGSHPEGIAVSADGNIVYIVNSDDATITAMNTIDNTIVKTFSIGGAVHPTGIVASPDGKTLYVTNYGSASVSVVDIASSTIRQFVPVGLNPRGIAITPDGGKLFVANEGTNSITVINTANNSPSGPVAVGKKPFAVAMAPDGNMVYVSNYADNTVSAIKTSDYSTANTYPVGSGPRGVSVTPDGTALYVCNFDSENITAITLSNGQVTTGGLEGGPFSFGNFIEGGAGCTIPPFNYTILVNPTPPTIFRSGSPSPLSIGYGVASAATSFNVSALSLTQGVLVKPPDGFEVSLDGDNFSPTVTVGSTGNLASTTVYIRLAAGATQGSHSGDITLSSPGATPVLVAMPASTVRAPEPTIITGRVSGEIYACSGQPSASPNILKFTMSAVNLNGALGATASTGFEVSLSKDAGFLSHIDISNDVNVPNTIIYVRASTAMAPGTNPGNITFTSGPLTQKVAITAVAYKVPTADTPTPPNQEVINQKASQPIHFTGTGNTFIWKNDHPEINLPESGTGDIASFTAVNNGTTDIVAHITAWPVSAPLSYVANFSNNSVSVISINTNELVATIGAGSGSKGIIIKKDATRLYVVNYASDDITVIDAATNSAMATIKVGSQPQGLSLNSDESVLSVYNSADNTVSNIDTKTNTLISTVDAGNFPPGTLFSPDGKVAYVYNYSGGSFFARDTETNKIITGLPGNTSPQGLVLSPDGNTIYISDASGATDGRRKSIYVINAADYSTITKIDVADYPQGMAITHDGKYLYVAMALPNQALKINTTTFEIEKEVTVGNFPSAIATTDGTGCEGLPVTCTIIVHPTPPTITAKGTPDVMTTIEGNASTPASSFIVSGIKMQEGILVTPPNGFEVSLDENGAYGSTVTIPLTRTDGVIADTKVFIRLAANTKAGTYANDVVMTSKNAENEPLTMPDCIVYPATAFIVASGASGSINTCEGAPSASPNLMKFTAYGFLLAGDIDVKAPVGFEVSTDANSGYSSGFTIHRVGTDVAKVTIYVRSDVSAKGSVFGDVTLRSPGAANGVVAVRANVGVTPYVNKVNDQPPITGGMNTLPVNFSGSVNTYYSWTNNNSSIGLAKSGFGNIATFTSVNKGNTRQVATVTVTPITAAFAYIALSNGRFSVINTATNTVIAGPTNIGTSTTPYAVTASPDGRFVYIANQTEGTISVINTNTNAEVLPRITVGRGPVGIAVSADGTKLYVANGSESFISVVDVGSRSSTPVQVGISPTGIALSPDGKSLYVVNRNSPFVSVINTADISQPPTKISMPGSSPEGIAVSPDGTRIYITNYNSRSVTVIDATYNTPLSPAIIVGNNPRGIAINNDGSKVYVTNSANASNSVSVIDTKTGSVTTIPVGTNPQGISISPDGSLVYVANSGSSNISVINVGTGVVSIINNIGGSPISFGNFITGGAGCTGKEMTFTITINPESAFMTTSGTLPPLYTTYGTVSSAGTFDVTGISLTGPITITPPPGLEVSTDNSNANFKSPLTFTPAKDGQPTTIYVRLSTTAPAKTYTDKIDISSPGAANVPVSLTAVTKVDPAPLDLVANKVTKTVNTVLTGGPGSKAFTQKGLMNNESIGSVTITYGPGAELSAATATYPGSVMVSDPVGGTFTAANYTINPIAADLVVSNIVNADLIKIPNAFSPNGDGVNDTWKISDLLNFPTSTVDIFDRSGRSIFHSVGYPIPWDGTFAGKYLPYGTYYYVIDIDNGAKRLSGYVLLIR